VTALRTVGVLGDVHAEDDRLDEALGWFEQRRVDSVLCVGDIVDGPGDIERTIELLRQHHVRCVAGNHDRWFLAGQMRGLPDATLEMTDGARAWLATLPATLALETVAGPMMLCHGIGTDDMSRLTPDSSSYDIESNDELQRILGEGRVRFVVGGHTHRRMLRTFGSVRVVNAGTLLRHHEPCVALIDFETETVVHVDFDDAGRVEVDMYEEP
jgi:predicted phosphodiesterase